MRWMGSRRVMRGMHWLRGAVRGARAERVLEPVLALLLASLAVLGQIQYSHRNDLALWLDLVTCAASALGAFRPKEGPWVFFAVLLAYLFVPQGWVTLGELSVLIAILGMGIRSQKRLRLILTPLMLAIVVFRSGEGRVLLTPLGFWILAVAAAWLVGDAFARSRDSQRQAVEVALMGQRTRIARDLHDVVAHDLTNVALRARQALVLGTQDPDDLRYIAQTASKCVDDMRNLMRLLRTTRGGDADTRSWLEPDVPSTLATQAERLRTAGFKVTAHVEGPLEGLTGTVPHALSWILIEACNNVLRHGDSSKPCMIFVTSSTSVLDLAVINSVAGSHLSLRPGRLGIIGMQERAIAAGGNLTVTPHDEKWIVKAEFPLRSYSMISDRA
jgi:signal transduction histidine kinase